MAPKQNTPRRHRSPAEKRRIVELTLRSGPSLRSIARAHGLHPNSLRKLDGALPRRKARCAIATRSSPGAERPVCAGEARTCRT
jgi:transposase-like protein